MKKLFSLLLALTFIQACGFHLKGQYYLPESLQSLHLSSSKKHSPLAKEVKVRLQQSGVKLLDESNAQITELRILPEEFQRRTLSLFPNGQVAEYELLYQANVLVLQPNKPAVNFNVELSREFQDDPNNALAKQRERELILTELRAIAADRILAQLNTIR
jgi:LPS-assembly lipoprotein